MNPATVREVAADLPDEPGVYQFLEDGEVRYVGKAVSLRDRVRSYADPRSDRIERMVRRADDVDVAVTDTETQALLLEANLIKRHAPRYNVRLKDDKSYPLVQLTDHERPRIEITRDPDEGATVFGPYTSMRRVETVVKALRETYGVRGCSDHKYSGRDRPCLDHELGLCTAPCTGEIAGEEYLADVESVKRFLQGETGILADPLRREMRAAADAREFERAANLRDRLETVEAFHGDGGAAVSATEDGTRDVLGVAVDGDRATVARLHAEGGKLVERDRHRLDAPAGEDRTARVLAAFVAQYYAERPLPDELLLPERIEDDDVRAWLDREGVETAVPGAGRRGKLVDLATKNARTAGERADGTAALAETLDLPAADRIEGFDVSHAGGRAVVGSNVTFVDGSAETAGYRRKKLPERNDDYANMRDLIEWRASRAVEGRDDRPDPDLVAIDGGMGQLRAACEALGEVGWDVPAVALAKGEDGDRVVTLDGPADVPEPALRLLGSVRDEAHRFAVQYHGTLRDSVETVLDDLPGVGPETRKRLLRRFGGVDDIRQASREELLDVEGIGEKTAEVIDGRL